MFQDDAHWEFNGTPAVAAPPDICVEWNDRAGPDALYKESIGLLSPSCTNAKTAAPATVNVALRIDICGVSGLTTPAALTEPCRYGDVTDHSTV